MRVNYIGPLVERMKHPVLSGYDLSCFASSCYLVEVSEEAGIEGPLIEGDVLVVDEARRAQHGDMVILEHRGGHMLYNARRIDGRLRLVPLLGPEHSVLAQPAAICGVVVSQARRYAS